MILESPIVAIMQPTFLPWTGYFSLINKVDIFVFLDNVKLSKQSWQTRVKVLSHDNKPQWITVPVIKNDFGDNLIKDIKIRQDLFPEKQIRTLEALYQKAFQDNNEISLLSNLILLIKKNNYSLSELNCKIINFLCKEMSLNTEIKYASKLLEKKFYESKSLRIVDILNKLNSKIYLTPPGSKEYLIQEKSVFFENNITIDVYNYNERKYIQRNSKYDFINGLSIIDSLAWNGKNKTATNIFSHQSYETEKII